MKSIKGFIGSIMLAMLLVGAAFAQHVTVDYDHSENFGAKRTYSWTKVQTANSIWDARVKSAIDQQLTAKGWTEVPSGGDVALVAVATTRIKRQLNTFYDGFGGWRWGGFGDATTTVDNYKVGTLIVDMFDANSKNLIWRGTASNVVSGNPEKNTKNLDKGVQKMFKQFPPKAAS